MRLPGILALEAIDSAGKTTQANLLADYLDGCNADDPSAKPALRVKFPNYESPTGKLILAKLKNGWKAEGAEFIVESQREQANALVLQSLMLTNRFEVADEIEYANVVQGRNVVLDRYFASGIAYGMADGLDYEWLAKIHTRLPKAHYVFIDIPVEESFKRRPERVDAYEGNKERLRLARINYLHLFERMGVDTSYWGTGPDLHDPAGWQEYRTSPSGYSIVNGIGSIEQVQNRIRKALDL